MTNIEMSSELSSFIDDWGCETLDEALTQATLSIHDIEWDIDDLEDKRSEMEQIRTELVNLIEVHGEGFEFGDDSKCNHKQ